MSKHASIHYLQAVPTESQLRQLGHVAEHIWRQVLQLVVPQEQFLVQKTDVFRIFSWLAGKTFLIKIWGGFIQNSRRSIRFSIYKCFISRFIHICLSKPQKTWMFIHLWWPEIYSAKTNCFFLT